MYVYIKHSEDLYLVGFYNPKGNFVVESKHEFSEDAAKRVNFLNGGFIHYGGMLHCEKVDTLTL